MVAVDCGVCRVQRLEIIALFGRYLADADDTLARDKNLAEDIDQALLAVRAQQHPRGTTYLRFVDDQLNIGRDVTRIWQVHVGYRIETTPVLCEIQMFLPLLSLH